MQSYDILKTLASTEQMKKRTVSEIDSCTFIKLNEYNKPCLDEQGLHAALHPCKDILQVINHLPCLNLSQDE